MTSFKMLICIFKYFFRNCSYSGINQEYNMCKSEETLSNKFQTSFTVAATHARFFSHFKTEQWTQTFDIAAPIYHPYVSDLASN